MNDENNVAVTFVMWGLGGSGGELLIYKLANRLLKDGISVAFASIVGYGYKEKELRNFNTYVRIQPKLQRIYFSLQYILEHKGVFTFPLLKLLFFINTQNLSKIVRETGGKRIIATSFYTAKAAHKCGGRYHLVQDTFEMFANGPAAKFRKYEMEKAFSLPLTKLCVSKYLMEEVYKYSKDVIYIGNFISDSFHECQADMPSNRKRIILTIARPGYNKGFDIFVKAMNELLKKRNDFEIHVINHKDSPLPIPFKYVGHGRVSEKELIKLYSSAYIFVFPSRAEGLGLPPLEAMACKTPVVLTDNGGSREYAINRYNSIIVPREDYKGLANAVSELLDNPELADYLAKNGINTVKNYRFSDFYCRFRKAVEL
ncbi:glycosyltransferase family 4 protein [Stygiolobus caldivivus]|uniref:Glycosyl transferase family 1 domain-containing protein n=1 Tax=Stygiolobus caldivivus TaxID=2824673 RepID=A0A8D5U4E9_9CREN|nr:glycosyltransferase family 4 protein [Stygiolobus caldivivus]BCU69057.1 hypothetical protein KN1_03540 [Stygiolobus caldivivus]